MKVLVAEDNLTTRTMMAAILKNWGFEVVAAIDGEEAWTMLQEADAPRMALLDWEMPGLDGVEICRRIRERETAGNAYTYLLLLTSRGDQRDIVTGIEAGADDYVVKPFDRHELRARMRVGQRIIELQTELYRLQEKFRHLSRTDSLTGCLNRRAILERLEAELARARRDGKPLGVAMLDIDHFKPINDARGHAAGDEVLCGLVRRLECETRLSDMFGRIGGEEFLILWPATDLESGCLAAESIRAGIEHPFFSVGEDQFPVTVSIGVTASGGDEPAEATVARADEALFAAKQNGRNRVDSVGGISRKERQEGSPNTGIPPSAKKK